MSEVACNTKLPSIGYPPVQLTALDQENLEQIRTVHDAAPFGRLKNGVPRSEIGYRVLVSSQKRQLTALDLRWPFWAGLGLGSVAVAVALMRSR